MRLSSVPRLKYVCETALLSTNFQGLSPQRIPAASIFWHLLSHAFFSCSFGVRRSRSLCNVFVHLPGKTVQVGGRLRQGVLFVRCRLRVASIANFRILPC